MDNEQMPALESMLSTLMQDPAKMAQLQDIAATLGLTPPAPSAEPTDTEEAADPAPQPQASANLSALLPMLSGSGVGSAPKKTRPDHRTALLLALRPYLNDGRREMIDAIVNLSRLGEMLGPGKEG